MLKYYTKGERLVGTVGNEQFDLYAVSGGGRGSKVKPQGDGLPRSRSFWTKMDEEGGVRGGVIPPGFYICRHRAHHETLGECIELEQTLTSLLAAENTPQAVPNTAHRLIGDLALHNRGSFYIHARGPHGSDGCIVVWEDDDRCRLNRAILHHNGTTLEVIDF